MTLIIVTAASVLLAAVVALFHRHYIFAAAIALLGAYELLGPIILLVLEDPSTNPALTIFAEYSSEQDLEGFAQALLLFFALFVSAYLLGGRPPGRHVPTRLEFPRMSVGLAIFPVVILAFGIVSVATGAGQTRLEDYVGIESAAESSRFFAYGGLLLVACTGIVLNKLSARQIVAALAIVTCVAPLLVELFIAGRRQWFAPSALLMLMFMLYSPVRFKALLAGGLTCVVAILFALQFALREEVQQGSTGFETQALAFAVLAPQLGEFVGIGSTSLHAWNSFVTGQTPVTNGVHWAFHALNTIPFLRLGDTWFPQYSADLYRMYNEIAPWGGLSMLADSLMAMGLLGVIVLAVAMGMLCRRAHEFTARVMRDGMPGDVYSLYVLSVVSTLLLKYRSGVGDALQSFVSFSVLFWFVAFLGYLTLDRRVGAISVLRAQNKRYDNSRPGHIAE